MKHLKEELSLKVYPGMGILCPRTGIVDSLDMTNIIRGFTGRRVYAIGENHRTICYLYNGDVYVTPWTRIAIATLKDSGYRKENFFVPFDSGELPQYDVENWQNLCQFAEETYRYDFINDCERWSNEHGIKRLSHSILRKCFEIPEDGMMVRHATFDERISPVLHQAKPDPMMSNYLGRFSCYRGLVVFVYRDGKTYVAKGYGLIRRLKRAGYKDTGIFVPFSDGSLPVNAKLREKWLSLPSF
ncbi:hypothetical protein IJH23_03215 [Candidatus Saccharibacteria bacterium]|nr:hypothetical protein [Candidatus Saccharibacteria bacterium]